MNQTKDFVSAVIVCDNAPGTFQQAIAIRSILEAFHVRVSFYQLVRKNDLLDFLLGNYSDCDYVIWFCYGSPGIDGEDGLNFQVVHQKDNNYTSKSGWEQINFTLKPSTVSQYVKNPKGTLICGAASGQLWAEAFISAGYQGYIAPTNQDLSCNSEILFLTGFFYHLLIHNLDYTNQRLTLQESVIAAASMDSYYEYGTKLFRYYE